MLACVDGTQSSEWLKTRTDTHRWNSNTRNFYDDCTHGPKHYIHGPNLVGTDVPAIAEDVWNFVMLCLRRNPNDGVYLVGHSRGGHIVTAVAGLLNQYGWIKHVPEAEAPPFGALFLADDSNDVANAIDPGGMAMAGAMAGLRNDAIRQKHGIPDAQISQPVNYLGLYDAVDRSMAFRTSLVAANVRLCYHARRDPRDRSRRWFGNTARHEVEPEVCTTRVRGGAPGCPYHEKVIMGSHGALGGAPGEGDIKYQTHLQHDVIVGGKRPADLQRCSTPVVTSPGSTHLLYTGIFVPVRTVRYECEVVDENIKQTEIAASLAADAYVREGARLAGLHFR